MASIPRKPVLAPLAINPGQQDEEIHDQSSLHEDDDPKNGSVIQELLLREISSKLGTIAETSRLELRLLNSVSDRISFLEDSKVEFLWNAVLQTIGIIFVIIFGVFAVLAYNASQISNKQSFAANQLSLLAFCNQVPYAADGVCLAISQQAVAPLTSLATAVLGPFQWTPTTSSTSFETTPQPTSSINNATSSSNSSTASTNVMLTSTFATSTTGATTSSLSSTSSNPTSLTSAVAKSSHSSPHLSTPAIAGIVVGVFSILISVGVSGFLFRVKFQRRPDRVVSPATDD